MTRFVKGGAVFLHIPKTGGNWVTKVLEKTNLIGENVGHKHADIDRMASPLNTSMPKVATFQLKRAFGNYSSDKPFMFCFVRHPLKWYESYFKYMSQESRNWCHWGNNQSIHKWHPNSILNDLGDPDFNVFMKNVVQKRPGYVTELFGYYTKYHVDFIGKQENLVEDTITVLKMLNLEFDEDFVRDFSPFGVSDKPKTPIEWDPDLKKEVQKLEYAGIRRYGYDVEDV